MSLLHKICERLRKLLPDPVVLMLDEPDDLERPACDELLDRGKGRLRRHRLVRRPVHRGLSRAGRRAGSARAGWASGWRPADRTKRLWHGSLHDTRVEKLGKR